MVKFVNLVHKVMDHWHLWSIVDPGQGTEGSLSEVTWPSAVIVSLFRTGYEGCQKKDTFVCGTTMVGD
jgi:hypothetical protein